MKDTGPMPPAAHSRSKWFRIASAIAVYTALLLLGHWGSGRLTEAVGLEPGSDALLVDDGAVWLGISAYALLLAIPFVPGIEISLGLLATFGGAIAIQVYLATVAALAIAYSIGRMVPTAFLSAFFRFFGLSSADALVQRLRPLSHKERLAVLVERAPRRYIPVLLQYRYELTPNLGDGRAGQAAAVSG